MTLNCETVRDLIPLCIEDCACEQSQELVKEHIEGCSECKAFYKQCEKDLRTSENKKASPATVAHNGYLKLSKRLKRRRIIKTISVCILGAVALVCIVKDVLNIVDNKDNMQSSIRQLKKRFF